MRCMLTEQEYMAHYPERVKNGRIFCNCGAINIRIAGNSIYVCAVCNALLYTTSNDNSPIREGRFQ